MIFKRNFDVIKDRIHLITSDITDQTVDAIVNAANTDLILGAGVAGAIRNKGGPTIQIECNALAPIGLGKVVITGAGNLPAKYIIHAAVMELGGSPDETTICDAALNTLKTAADRRLDSIAFPALGTGVGGFPLAVAARILLTTTMKFLIDNEYPEIVKFVLFDEKSLEVFERDLTELSK
ncbi:MAG: O-acetyl-ADP-ribose deacetylase [Calditrichaeota bacterium]|nr:O-acetyl-ADP-ribose deacetylase [Calditrichota bacterium]